MGQREDAIAREPYTVAEDTMLLCCAEDIDVIIDTTCEVDFVVQIVLETIQHRKHMIMKNAELDSIVGPI